MSRKKKNRQETIYCPYCRRKAVLRPTAYVYGNDNLNPEGFLYVCSGYPQCDAYVGAHKESLRPKGTLANGALRHKRILAHRALDAIWKEGYMTRHSAYIWLQNRLNLRKRICTSECFRIIYVMKASGNVQSICWHAGLRGGQLQVQATEKIRHRRE